MPIIKSAIKRAKQTAKRRERNVGIKRDIKDATKTFVAKPSAKALSAAQSEIDTAVKKGLIKKNTAARRKANLAKIAKNAGVKLEASAKKATAKKPAVAKKPAAKAAPKAAASRTTLKVPTRKPAAAKAPVKSAVRRTATKKAAK